MKDFWTHKFYLCSGLCSSLILYFNSPYLRHQKTSLLFHIINVPLNFSHILPFRYYYFFILELSLGIFPSVQDHSSVFYLTWFQWWWINLVSVCMKKPLFFPRSAIIFFCWRKHSFFPWTSLFLLTSHLSFLWRVNIYTYFFSLKAIYKL